MPMNDISDALGTLMFQICRAHRNRAQDLLSSLGLYSGQEILLMHLWEKDGRTQSELAQSMWIRPPTLTKSIDRMSHAGLVERRADMADGRSVAHFSYRSRPQPPRRCRGSLATGRGGKLCQPHP